MTTSKAKKLAKRRAEYGNEWDESSPHPGVQARPTPSLPKLRFMERPELPPFEEWVRS